MTTWFNRIQLSTGGTAYLLVNYKSEDSDEFLLSISDGGVVWKGKCKNYRLFIRTFTISKTNVYMIEIKIKPL